MELIPNTKSLYFKNQQLSWTKIQTILQGEEGVKEAGPLYLPKLSGQTPAEYNAYKDRGSFFNAFARTAEGLTGAIVRKEPSIKTASQIDALLGNITLNGESIQEVIRMITKDVISFGYYGVLVDMPPVAEGSVATVVPYFALYSCASILNFETVQMGDENKLVMLALDEMRYEKNPENSLELIEVEHVRLLQIEEEFLVVRIYKKAVDAKGKESWDQVGEDILPKVRGKRIDFIPFVFFGAQSNAPVPTNPPLMDLANLNIKHWQVSVDYYHGLHYCAMPTPWAAGFPASAELFVGAMKAWVSEAPEARCGFLEFTGTGLGAISTALNNLEKQMSILGARMLEEQKRAAEAAETVVMRYSGDTATLANIVTSIEAGMIKCINLLGYWMAIKDAKTEVHMNRDFVAAKLSAQDISALLGAYTSGGMSLDTFLYNLQVGEILPADRDIATEKSLIEMGNARSFENTLPPTDENIQ